MSSHFTSKTFCGMSLRGGGIFIGLLSILGTLLQINFVLQGNWEIVFTSTLLKILSINNVYTWVSNVLTVLLLTCGLKFTWSVLLIFGICLFSPWMILPWLIQSIVTCLEIPVVFVMFSSSLSLCCVTELTYSVLVTLTFGVHVTMIVAVYSLYQEIRCEKSTAKELKTMRYLRYELAPHCLNPRFLRINEGDECIGWADVQL